MSKVTCFPVDTACVKLHKAAHTVYKMQCHIVWVTKYCRKILIECVAKYG